MIFECPHCQGIIEISEKTNPQNRYFHLCCKLIGEHFGYTMPDMKHLLKEHFELYKEFPNKKTGEIKRRYLSIAELTKKEMTELIDNVYNFAMSYNIHILTPEEYFLKIKSLENENQ